MATQNGNGSSPDVNDTTEEKDRIHLTGVFLGSRFDMLKEVMGIEDIRPGDLLRSIVEEKLTAYGWKRDEKEDERIETQLTAERKAYAEKLAAAKAAKASAK